MAWVEPEYSVQEVNAAGKLLVAYGDRGAFTAGDSYELAEAMHIVNNWRASHAYPLNTFQVNLRNVARKHSLSPLVAQRIKRMFSIHHKLDRLRSMKLSQMQDLGGCRAILHDVNQVRNVVNFYQKQSGIKHTLVSLDDYVDQAPKASGYRGFHLVYRYFSDKKKTMYNGLKIEMQIRSQYQHAWATAVETVGMFSGQALKSSLGSVEWQRFFSLMGSAIALREGTSLVPGTPLTRAEIVDELKYIAEELNVEHRLGEYNRALHAMATNAEGAHYYLMRLNPDSKTLQISGYSSREGEKAAQEYARAEQEQKNEPGMDAVLVSVESVGALAKAYPNYFADTRLFLELMKQAISGRSRGIKLSNAKVAVT